MLRLSTSTSPTMTSREGNAKSLESAGLICLPLYLAELENRKHAHSDVV